MIVFPCLNRSLGRNLFTYSIASSVNPARELSSFTPFFASFMTSSFVHSRFGQRYPNIRGFRQYLLVFCLKQYNLLSKEFSLHFPIFIFPDLGEGHFVNNRFIEARNLNENRTSNMDRIHAREIPRFYCARSIVNTKPKYVTARAFVL